MDSITLENFRCFRERQTARLAPLTLLVGENSTGKTSFMALIRALWDVGYGHQIPDFKATPYDLGSYDEIANHRNANGHPAEQFVVGFENAIQSKIDNSRLPYYFEATFEKWGTIPVPTKRLISGKGASIEEIKWSKTISLRYKTKRGEWKETSNHRRLELDGHLTPMSFYADWHLRDERQGISWSTGIDPLFNSPTITRADLEEIQRIADGVLSYTLRMRERPLYYASAPVRSKPKRTYDPSRPIRDPEGDHVPMYLAYLNMQDKEAWKKLQSKLESFGRDAGLFDQISINQLGRSVGSPFQIQIRKFSQKRKGPQRNLVDVGYGISQILPLITELLREDAPDIFLFQQPEIHLHPSARAALGSLFCQVASNNKQLIIETHNDYILDRVRMDIRDQSSPLKPEDVSILFFERRDLDVRIHSLRYDGLGNVLDTPPGYRRFFMEEVRRSIGI